MTRLICVFLLSLIPALGNSQVISQVNFDQIKAEISDSSSLFFYPLLVERFLAYDTTLTTDEFKHLYFGNAFQSYYHPYGATALRKSFLETSSEETSFSEMEAMGEKVLMENPVDLEVILKMLYLYVNEKKKDKALVFARLYVSFLEVIYASGDGLSCSSAFVVMSVDDEYRIAGDLGLKVIKQALIGECDRLAFSKKEQGRKNRIKELFFNVRIPLTYLSESYNQPELPLPEVDPDEEE